MLLCLSGKDPNEIENRVTGPLASLLIQVAVPLLLSGQPVPPSHADNFDGHPRLIVISDIGNEPDDQMSLTRLLL